MKSKTPFTCKSGTLDIFLLRLHSLDNAALSAFAERTPKNFFAGRPCVAELDALPEAAQKEALPHIDWGKLIADFSERGLNLIGLRGGIPALRQSAKEAGLAWFDAEERARPLSNARFAAEEFPGTDEENNPKPPETAPDEESEQPSRARGVLFLDRPLRSGQVVYARNSDLVVTAFVSPGAEIMADGNIYAYAPLRGRAHAGVCGDVNARILATHFAAEVVAIAHLPLALAEDEAFAALTQKPAQARREEDEIKIEALT
ncbi:MAG: septum site-determining protein MinC [Zoogloeaceae bacterium]|jgi:septum site-determining protein MinC|nr:septum site-determining protein MinC [Zoogloeaceae bacterium]